MISLAAIARPYARAAFEAAQAENALAAWSGQLATAAAAVQHPEMAVALNNPRVERQQLADVLVAAGGDQLGTSVANLFRLLADNRRLPALPEIAIGFEALRAAAEERLPVTVRSAIELSAEQRQQIETKLATRFGRQVEASYAIDPSLIGGAVIEAGDVIIDGSLRNKLERLRGALHKG